MPPAKRVEHGFPKVKLYFSHCRVVYLYSHAMPVLLLKDAFISVIRFRDVMDTPDIELPSAFLMKPLRSNGGEN